MMDIMKVEIQAYLCLPSFAVDGSYDFVMCFTQLIGSHVRTLATSSNFV